MIIQIDGGSITNKGAQLMLYAVLQEIEKKHPEAKVVINNELTDMSTVRKLYKLDIVKKQSNVYRIFLTKLKITAVVSKIFPRVSWIFSLKIPSKNVTAVLNIGGFQFGDQWNHDSISIRDWERYLGTLQKYGTKNIFLSQAFGPFENEQSKRMVKVLDENTDLLIARDSMSFQHLSKLEINKTQLVLYPDFTSLVKGISSQKADSIKGMVCIIPNSKMIIQQTNSKNRYIEGIVKTINHIRAKGRDVFLLNHEGSGDYSLCLEIKEQLNLPIRVLQDENALITKGIVASSYMVISSRYHGVANALNSYVPCLATSWSHKYKMLMNDYEMEDAIVNYENMEHLFARIDYFLDENNNRRIRDHLLESVESIKVANQAMWDKVWSVVE